MEDDLSWKTTYGGSQPLEKDDQRWKTTFGGPCMLPTPLCGIFLTEETQSSTYICVGATLLHKICHIPCLIHISFETEENSACVGLQLS